MEDYNIGSQLGYRLFDLLDATVLEELRKALLEASSDDEAAGGMLDAIGDANTSRHDFTGEWKI